MLPAALVVAAGRGERLGSGGPKAFVVCGGRPLIAWSLEALRAAGIEEIVVALPDGVDDPPPGTVAVRGGAERSHSVRNALHASTGDPVLVHDAARPLTTPQLIAECLEAIEHADAAIAAAPMHDTVKEGDAERRVVRTLDRRTLWAIQTPQVFRRAVLERALDQPDDVLAQATDDASLIEAQGGTVRLVPAPRTNLKVTTPEDLELAEHLLTRR